MRFVYIYTKEESGRQKQTEWSCKPFCGLIIKSKRKRERGLFFFFFLNFKITLDYSEYDDDIKNTLYYTSVLTRSKWTVISCRRNKSPTLGVLRSVIIFIILLLFGFGFIVWTRNPTRMHKFLDKICNVDNQPIWYITDLFQNITYILTYLHHKSKHFDAIYSFTFVFCSFLFVLCFAR